jgi:hypothetical protein
MRATHPAIRHRENWKKSFPKFLNVTFIFPLLLFTLVSAGCVSVNDIPDPVIAPALIGPEDVYSPPPSKLKAAAERPAVRKPEKFCFDLSSLMRAVCEIPVRPVPEAAATSRRDWNYIIVHHSASDSGNAKTIGAFHRRIRHWKHGLAYHFVIGNGNQSGDGGIESGPRWRLQQSGAHAGINKYNIEGIGICVIGDFEKEPPSARQLASLRDLVRALCLRYAIPLSNVKGHCDIRCTKCPGRRFPWREFKTELARVMTQP